MEQRARRWNSKRYLADCEKLLVHDRLTHRCGKDALLGIVRRGSAVGFRLDTLATAMDWGYTPCPWCVPSAAKPKMVVPTLAYPPPSKPRPLPP